VCDIRQLSQIYAGFLSPRKLKEIGLLEAKNENDLTLAQAIFSPAGQIPSHMPDFF
jgi:predicted acetyltransferase